MCPDVFLDTIDHRPAAFMPAHEFVDDEHSHDYPIYYSFVCFLNV